MLGWEVVHVYSDNDLSAYSGSRRPAYTQLLADIESGRIQGLLAWHPDRLHRRPIEHEHFIDLVERKSLKIQTIAAGHYDLSTPSGRMFARSLSAYARMESEHKGQRIAESRKQKAREGSITEASAHSASTRTASPSARKKHARLRRPQTRSSLVYRCAQSFVT